MADILQQHLKQFSKEWANKVLLEMKGSVRQHLLTRRMKQKTIVRAGEVERIAFKVPLYGFYYDLGVGKGRAAGSAAAKLLAQQQGFLNPAIDAHINELADEVAAIYGNELIRNLKTN